MTKARASLLVLFSLCSVISIVWGFAVVRSATKIILDFDIVYMGSSAVIHHADLYNPAEVGKVYRSVGRPVKSVDIASSTPPTIAVLQVNVPTAYLCLAPFALLSITTAHLLWVLMSTGACTLAGFLVWMMAEKRSPASAFYLIGFMLANCGVLFAGGNPAGPTVGFCIIAVWCFLHDRYIPVGIICMALSLAIKPHDSGFIWLYFFLVGGIQRKRAAWSLGVTCLLAVISIAWILPVSPHWLTGFLRNLTTVSQPGGANDPSPLNTSVGPGMVVNLQSVFSVLRDVPGFYNLLAYGICGIMLAVWIFTVIRTRFSITGAYLGLAAISCLSMLPVYHRAYDARLILLTIPACALLLSEGGQIGRIALALNALAFFVVSDLPLAALTVLTRNHQSAQSGFGSQVLTVALFRPVPIVLLALGVLYLSLFIRRARTESDAAQNTGLQQVARVISSL